MATHLVLIPLRVVAHVCVDGSGSVPSIHEAPHLLVCHPARHMTSMCVDSVAGRCVDAVSSDGSAPGPGVLHAVLANCDSVALCHAPWHCSPTSWLVGHHRDCCRCLGSAAAPAAAHAAAGSALPSLGRRAGGGRDIWALAAATAAAGCGLVRQAVVPSISGVQAAVVLTAVVRWVAVVGVDDPLRRAPLPV